MLAHGHAIPKQEFHMGIAARRHPRLSSAPAPPGPPLTPRAQCTTYVHACMSSSSVCRDEWVDCRKRQAREAAEASSSAPKKAKSEAAPSKSEAAPSKSEAAPVQQPWHTEAAPSKSEAVPAKSRPAEPLPAKAAPAGLLRRVPVGPTQIFWSSISGRQVAAALFDRWELPTELTDDDFYTDDSGAWLAYDWWTVQWTQCPRCKLCAHALIIKRSV